MEPLNFLEEEMHNVCCIVRLVVGDEVRHLIELVYHKHDNILPPRGLQEGHNEVHASVIPRP